MPAVIGVLRDARRDRVHPDAVGAELTGRDADELAQAHLGHAVVDDADVGEDARARGGGDDRPTVAGRLDVHARRVAS